MLSMRVSSFAEVEAEINRKLKKIPDVAAKIAKKIIIDNSASSTDIKGKKLKEYSDEYKKFRARHGLSTTPDLRSTGHLLDEQNTKGGSLRPNSSDTLKAEGIMKIRKFYPENDSDIVPSFEDRISKGIEKVMTDAGK